MEVDDAPNLYVRLPFSLVGVEWKERERESGSLRFVSICKLKSATANNRSLSLSLSLARLQTLEGYYFSAQTSNFSRLVGREKEEVYKDRQ